MVMVRFGFATHVGRLAEVVDPDGGFALVAQVLEGAVDG
jgi:hypothetical protein